jgi:glutathione S-transferase
VSYHLCLFSPILTVIHTLTRQAEWAANLSQASEGYRTKFLPDYYAVLAGYYGQSGGPFLLGDRVTYADFAVYQSVDNDEGIGALPVGLLLSGCCVYGCVLMMYCV